MDEEMNQELRNAIRGNMHGLLEALFRQYANLLRPKYPDKTIRNADVFTSGVKEFTRLGYIELVDARTRIPDGLPPGLVRTIKRAKHQPIWIPGPKFPDEPFDLFEIMKPQLSGNEVSWQHCPVTRRNTWRDPILF
jgi:hypothetical protein